MTELNKQSLRMRNYLDMALKSGVKLLHLSTDELKGLLDELEAAERQNSYLREQRDEWERKAVSNFEECAEMSSRIEELEAKLANPVLLPKTNGYWNEQEKAYEEAITLARRQIRLAGFRCEGDE